MASASFSKPEGPKPSRPPDEELVPVLKLEVYLMPDVLGGGWQVKTAFREDADDKTRLEAAIVAQDSLHQKVGIYQIAPHCRRPKVTES